MNATQLTELRRTFRRLAKAADRRSETSRLYEVSQRNVGRADAYWHAVALVEDARAKMRDS